MKIISTIVLLFFSWTCVLNDLACACKEKTDAKGQTIQFGYDSNGRLLSKSYPDTSTVQFTYTSTGKRLTVSDKRGTTNYVYDNRDRLATVTNSDNMAINYTYDPNGRIGTISSIAGTISYIYTSGGRLKEVRDPQGNVTSYSYDPAGNRTGLAYPNGISVSYVYDINNRLTNLTHKNSVSEVLASYSYTLGAIGNRTRIDESKSISRAYEYDKLYRLTKETVTDPANVQTYQNDYTYDAVGNRLNKTNSAFNQPVVSNDYTYNAADQLITENGVTYTYDLNGNLASKTDSTGTTTYEHDYDNRLVKASSSSGVITYQYDVDGNRVEQAGGSGGVRYLVDTNRSLAQVIAEYTTATTVIASYVYADDLISMKRAGQTYYYHFDGLGSTRLLTNAVGTVTDTYDYDAFGNVIARTGTTENAFLFTGQQYDANIGFYYLRARYYAPLNGRFIALDPFAGDPYAPMSLHRYLYAADDPVNKIDPTGMEFDIGSLAISMAFSGILNSIASFSPGQAFGQVAENFAIGALEGAAFYGVGLAAIRAFMKFGRLIKVARLTSSIEKYWKKIISPIGTIDGTGLPEFFVFNTKVGKFFVSSGGGGGALKHVVEYLMRSPSAGATRLAETLALGELEEAIVLAASKGIVNMETVTVKTAFAEWKLIFQTEVQSGQLPKLFHAIFTPL